VFKIEGSYDTPWGTGIGLYWIAESGTPLQTEMREKGIPFYPFGRGDLGRTAATTRTDLFLQHDITTGRHKFKIGLNVENLFDQDTVTRIFTVPYRDTFNVSDQVFFSGTFDPVALQASAPGTYRPDPRFKQADQWMQRREMRLELKYSF